MTQQTIHNVRKYADRYNQGATVPSIEDAITAAREEYLHRWAEGVFRLFDPYDYQLYRVYAETSDPLLAITTSPGERT